MIMTAIGAIVIIVLSVIGSVPVWIFGISWWIHHRVLRGDTAIESTIIDADDPDLANPRRAWILGNLATIVSLTHSYKLGGGGCLVCGGDWWRGWPLPWLGQYGFTGMMQLYTLPMNILFWFLVSWLLLWCAALVIRSTRLPYRLAQVACVLIPWTAALPGVIAIIRN